MQKDLMAQDTIQAPISSPTPVREGARGGTAMISQKRGQEREVRKL